MFLKNKSCGKRNPGEVFALVKSRIENTSKIIQLANQ